MKNFLLGSLLTLLLIFTTLPVYAANIQIKVDGIAVTSDVEPEIINNRTMVPVRVISENLGAKVNWSNSEVTLTKNNMQVKLKLNSITAVKNGKEVPLDMKPYIKNNRTMVPLRFLAETFGSNVNYRNFTVTVDTEPMFIDGVKVKALQYEYHMTMGGVVQQIKGNTYNKAIYNMFLENKGNKVEAPASYAWHPNIDIPGFYYKNAQYDFLDIKGNSIKRFDIYSLLTSPFPGETMMEYPGYPEFLLHDATANQWYLFSDTARQSINQLIDTAAKNGFLEVISNTVV